MEVPIEDRWSAEYFNYLNGPKYNLGSVKSRTLNLNWTSGPETAENESFQIN